MEKTVELNLETIIRECSNNPNLAMDYFYYFSLENRENIHQIFKYKKFNDDFSSRLCCYNDDKKIVGYIRPSYAEFLDKLLTILNIEHKEDIKDDDNLTKKMLDRLEVLKGIKTQQELYREFPVLYRDLVDGRKYYENLVKLRRQEQCSEEQFVSGEHYYYSCALKKSLQRFIETQSEMYRRYIVDRHKLKELQETKSYNNYIRKNFKLPKLYMYIIHEYLRHCESTEDLEEIKRYLKLVERYFLSRIDKNQSLVTKDGTHIDYENIISRYDSLKKQVLERSKVVEWILVPESIGTKKTYKSNGARTISLNLIELQRLREIGETKQEYYAKSGYVAKAIGLRRYHGYVAYIYENGEVILDREYNSEYPRTAKGDAIYNIKAKDFDELSRQDKKVLMRDSRANRIIHTKNWEDRVDKIIKREATEEAKEETKQLIKRLQKKKY